MTRSEPGLSDVDRALLKRLVVAVEALSAAGPPADRQANRHLYAEAAVILRVKESWLCRHIKRLPHSKKGHVVTFTDADLDAIDEMHHVCPAPSTKAIPGLAAEFANLKPKGPRKRRNT